MESYNSKLYPEPDKKDAAKMKEFFTLKYKQKRFSQKEEDSSSEESDSDTEKKKKKAKKEESKKKHKKADSSEEYSDKEKKKKKHHHHHHSSDEDEKPTKVKVGAGKLGAPPGGLSKKVTPVAPKEAAPPVTAQVNFLELDFDQPKPTTQPVQSAPASDGWGSWATFDTPTAPV